MDPSRSTLSHDALQDDHRFSFQLVMADKAIERSTVQRYENICVSIDHENVHFENKFAVWKHSN